MTDVSAPNALHHKSPLDTLVRQSSRRAQHPSRLQPALTPPRHGGSRAMGAHGRNPSSPLLHTRFRTSASTNASTENSFMELLQDEDGSTITGQDLYWPSRDDESVYSAASGSPSYSPSYDTPNFAYVVDAVGDHSPTLPPSPTPSSPSAMPEQDRKSWASHDSDGTIQEGNRASTGTVRDTWRSSASGVDPFSFKRYESPRTEVPKVVVSSPMPDSSYDEPPITPQWTLTPSDSPHSTSPARPSAIQYNASNFSRPIRPSTTQDEQSKRNVLERNRSARRSPTPVSPQSFPQQQQQQQQDDYYPYADQPTSPYNNQQQDYYRRTPSPAALPSPQYSPSTLHSPQYSPATLNSPQYPPEPPDSGWAESNTPAIFRSTSADAVVSNSQIASRSQLPASPAPNISRSVSANAVPGSSTSHIRLPNAPPSPRPISRVYSSYSYYQLEDGSRTPSPASPHFPAQAPPPSRSTPNVNISANTDAKTSRSRSRSRPRAPAPAPSSHTTPDEFLQLGIQHHEANRLAESATCFERAATVDGGCGVGMLMWGLSLRHAWGTPKDEKAGFRWLRRAAEAAVGDLEAAREGQDQKAVKTELVLAIYEVGQCFFHGWGVPQDKKMAVSYFQVAARLGDGDAQQELGYCLANGKGCKKDLKEAAKWYRAAAAQGASTVGLAWIYKAKYA